MDFIEKGMISHKYLADGCEFKKVKNNFKLLSTQNIKYQPFIGKTLSESMWDLISEASLTSGEDYNKFYGLLLDHLKSGHTIFNANANILLKKGEEVVFQSPNNIILKEPKSIRVTNSVHAGSGHRHGKSSFGYGVSKSVGESKDVIKVIDQGQLIITNKRFIFSGNNRTIDVNISQITGITPYSDGFKLQRKSKQKPEYFTNVDGFAFNYNFRNEKYFFIMNGQIIKALLEGGLNKKPQTSKLQQLASQPQITNETETVKATLDDYAFEFKDHWKQINSKQKDHVFTLEKVDGKYRAKIEITKTNYPGDDETFEKEIRDVFAKNNFELNEFTHTTINGIDMLVIYSQSDSNGKIVEFNVAYFNNPTYRYSIRLINNQLDTTAKQEYEEILNSIKLKDDSAPLKMKYCPNCGTQVEKNGKFCVNCGFKLS